MVLHWCCVFPIVLLTVFEATVQIFPFIGQVHVQICTKISVKNKKQPPPQKKKTQQNKKKPKQKTDVFLTPREQIY